MYMGITDSNWGTLRLVADAWSGLRLVWIPFTCLNTPAGLCKFYAWPENQLDSFKYYVPIWRVIWRLVHHMTMYGLSAWSAWIFTPGFRVVTRRHVSYRWPSLGAPVTGGSSLFTQQRQSTEVPCLEAQVMKWSSISEYMPASGLLFHGGCHYFLVHFTSSVNFSWFKGKFF